MQAQNAAGVWECSHTEQEQCALFITQVTRTPGEHSAVKCWKTGKKEKPLLHEELCPANPFYAAVVLPLK